MTVPIAVGVIVNETAVILREKVKVLLSFRPPPFISTWMFPLKLLSAVKENKPDCVLIGPWDGPVNSGSAAELGVKPIELRRIAPNPKETILNKRFSIWPSLCRAGIFHLISFSK